MVGPIGPGARQDPVPRPPGRPARFGVGLRRLGLTGLRVSRRGGIEAVRAHGFTGVPQGWDRAEWARGSRLTWLIQSGHDSWCFRRSALWDLSSGRHGRATGSRGRMQQLVQHLGSITPSFNRADNYCINADAEE